VRSQLAHAVGISSAIGAVSGIVVAGATPRAFLQGALTGALIALFVHLSDVAVAGFRPTRWRFGLYVAITALATVVAICAGFAVAALPWVFVDGLGSWRIYAAAFLVAVVASIGFTWWFALDRLLGRGVLLGLLTGRYHHPRREERVFLFADLQLSTPIAERLGELRYHEFLNRVFIDAARPVERHGGQIHEYVGDEMVVTWKLEHGVRDWRCLRCALAIEAALGEARDGYEQEFGAVPQFRFALHSGVVVAGELGDLRREIAYTGETVNTAARIEAVAKESRRELVASEDVLRHAPLPPDLTAESLGTRHLGGKERPLELFAVTAAREASGGSGDSRSVSRANIDRDIDWNI
jgi:adenylate cyclase